MIFFEETSVMPVEATAVSEDFSEFIPISCNTGTS
jgi:hypothetical protein